MVLVQHKPNSDAVEHAKMWMFCTDFVAAVENSVGDDFRKQLIPHPFAFLVCQVITLTSYFV